MQDGTASTTTPTTEPGGKDDGTNLPPSQARTRTPKQADYRLDGPAKTLMDRCVKDASHNTARLDRDRQDWLNLLFDRGGAEHQYVIWDAGTNRWITRGTDPKKGGLPEWMPRPVTNLYSNKLDGIASLMDQSEPSQVWKPETDDDEDLATAHICDDAIAVLRDEIDYANIRPAINRQICLTDKAAIVLWYDNDERHGVQEIRALQCESCQDFALPMDQPEEEPDVCQTCGGPLNDAVDPMTGQPIGVSYPVGRMCASSFQSFEFSLPRSARSHRADKNPWVLFHARYAWEDAAREFPDEIDAIKDRSGWKTSSIQRQYADAARRLSAPRSAAINAGSDGSQNDGPVLYRLYHDPIDDGEVYFPQGLYAVMLNGQLIKAEPLAFKTKLPNNGGDRYFKNVLIRTFRPTPHSPYGKPPADDLVPLQYTRNLLEALLLSILLHHASPRTYLPLSVTLEKPITGIPGEVIPFRSTVPGETPTTVAGQNPPDGLYKWIEQIDAKFDELSKLNAVLQGERPEGEPTLGEIQILKEQGQGAFSEPLLEAVRFERDLSRMLLWVARDTIWTARLRAVAGRNREWEIKQFSAADLMGNVDVDIDPATAWPKSIVMERAKLNDLLKLGVFTLLQTNPELATKILEQYDATDFLPSLDQDRQQIMRELDRWRQAQGPQDIKPPDPDIQNIPMHLLHKIGFLKTEEAEQLQTENLAVYQAMRQHVQMLQQYVAQHQQPKGQPPRVAFSVKTDLTDPDARKVFEQTMGIPPTEPPPPKPTGKEQPSGDVLNRHLASGALRPAGGQGTSLDAHLAAGTLHPAGAHAAATSGQALNKLIASGVMHPAPPTPPHAPSGAV